MDYKRRNGLLKNFTPVTFPGRIGYDVSGTVVDAGAEAAAQWRKGDPVFARQIGGGTVANMAFAAAEHCAKPPANIDLAEAAGLPLAGQTALQVRCCCCCCCGLCTFDHWSASPLPALPRRR